VVGVFEGHGGGGIDPDGDDTGLAFFVFHDELRAAGEEEDDGKEYGAENAEDAFFDGGGRIAGDRR